ncbi:MAG: amidohydrolase family protein [Promethearchaeota archaeon]
MSLFRELTSKQSPFYRRLWQELSEVPVFDTHEHIRPETSLRETPTGAPRARIPAYEVFDRAYVHGFDPAGTHADWANVVRRQAGTGYVKSVLWAVEELFGISPPVTPLYMERLEVALNEAYDPDSAAKYERTRHMFEDLMHVETVVLNTFPLESHRDMPQPTFQAAAGLPSICTGILVPTRVRGTTGPVAKPDNVPYWFAETKLGMDLESIRNLDDYLDVVDKLIDWLADPRDPKFLCSKFQLAYERPISFPEPDEDDSRVRALFNRRFYSEEELWLFGDHVMHYFLEETSMRWKRPVQFHTGLARMFDGGSNALNLSHLFQKFPDVEFDLFHGNYPWHMVLAGMLHQIPNVHADLCWLPIISPTAAQQVLTQCVELGDMAGVQEGHEPSYRTNAFGGDCGIAEGSYGALLMAKDVVCRTMEDLHERGLILEADAVDIAERLLRDNPRRLFGNVPR